MPYMTTYADKTDPYDYMQNYESPLILHGWEDEIMCRVFSLTLTGHTLKWLNELKEVSISSFDQLRSEFLKAFMINTQRKKDATYLLTLKQGNKESLKSYVDHFRDTTLKVKDLQVKVAMTAMLQGTKVEML